MRVCGIICEYDPFHAGHAYHIARARALSEADYVVCLMSGAFTQRGTPAVLPARDRARMALLGGADAVLQAPYFCSAREAEHFALGFARILDALGVTHLAFGTETEDMALLSEAAALLEENDGALNAARRRALDRGLSFAEATGRALEEALNGRAAALRKPNALLAMNYLRAIRRLGSGMIPVPVPRVGAYHAQTGAGYASASAVRGALMRGDWRAVENAVPGACFPALADAVRRGALCRPEYADKPLRVRLLSMSPGEIAALPEVSEGLENRISAAAKSETTREDIIRAVKTRRYPYSRISRALCHALVGATKDDFAAPYLYARVLGFRLSAAPLMRALKAGGFPLVTRPARELSPTDYALDARADAVRRALTGEPAGAEYRDQPILIP